LQVFFASVAISTVSCLRSGARDTVTAFTAHTALQSARPLHDASANEYTTLASSSVRRSAAAPQTRTQAWQSVQRFASIVTRHMPSAW